MCVGAVFHSECENANPFWPYGFFWPIGLHWKLDKHAFSKIMPSSLYLLSSVTKANFYTRPSAFLPRSCFLPFTFQAYCIVEAELSNYKKDQVMSLWQGCTSTPASETVMVFSVSPVSRTAFMNVSEAQVERLQMFIWMSLGWPVDVIFLFGRTQSTPVIYNLMEAVAGGQGTALSKLQPSVAPCLGRYLKTAMIIILLL